jgi:hypothetical protein
MSMANKTRYFVIASLLVLTVGLGTGLVAYYVGLPAAFSIGPNGPDELQYVPREASIVAYADVREIMTSEVRQKIRRSAAAPEDGQRQFKDQTGIDIESDIDRVVASLRPMADGGTGAVVVARGRFDPVKIEALMREHGAAVNDYNGRRVISRGNRDGSNSAGSDSFALSFLEPGLVAVGNVDMVRATIDLQKGGENITANPELMGLVGSLESGHAWVVGRLDALTADGRLPAQIASRLPTITTFSVSGRVDNALQGTVRAEARDEKAANELRDVIRGFVALAKLQASARPEFQTLLQSLELGGSGKTVALSFSVPGEVFDNLPPKR